MTHRPFFLCFIFSIVAACAADALPPANDSFTTRQILGSTATVSVEGDNTDATHEAGETTYGGIASSSVWYEWTAPATGWVKVSSLTLTLDSVLGVFTGSSVSTLTQAGFNDDAAQPEAGYHERMSTLAFHAVAGTSYQISVSGYDDGSMGSSGAFTLMLGYSTPAFAVTGLTFTPAAANVTNAAAAMTLNLTATSTMSPVSMRVRLIHPEALVDHLETRYLELVLNDAERVSGTAANGMYQLAFTLPRHVPGADWKAVVFAHDGTRDARWSHGSDFIDDDYALPPAAQPVIAVTNTGLVDNAAPTLTAFTASSTSIDGGSVAEAGRVITFQLDLTDGLSGFASGSIELDSPLLLSPLALATFTTADLSSGDALNGTYVVNAVIPYGLATGAYDVRVRVRDASLVPDSISNIPGSSDTSMPALADSQITVTGTGGYPAWASTQLFPTGQFGPDQDADGDGVSNLLEYACNLNPASADAVTVAAGSGASGLPGIGLLTTPDKRLRVEFLRRKATTGSGLVYAAQFCDTLLETGTGAWADAAAKPVITSIDETWERVVIEDSTLNAARRFARVKITYTQP
ncbi:MAG: hypothetical protein ACO1TE_03960 [Prosthecobacter sp.]